MRRRSSAIPHSLLVVDSSCGHNWCLCFCQMGQSWRMWWAICSASLQSQSAESMMPIRFRCAHRPQCPVRNLNIVVCSCLARRLGQLRGCSLQWRFSIDIFDQLTPRSCMFLRTVLFMSSTMEACSLFSTAATLHSTLSSFFFFFLHAPVNDLLISAQL